MGTGVTIACRQELGTSPSVKEQLKMWATMPANSNEQSWKSQDGKGSGPGEVDFTWRSIGSTSKSRA